MADATTDTEPRTVSGVLGTPPPVLRALDRDLRSAERILCPHCTDRFSTFAKLDTHIRHRCPVLRERRGEG